MKAKVFKTEDKDEWRVMLQLIRWSKFRTPALNKDGVPCVYDNKNDADKECWRLNKEFRADDFYKANFKTK